MTSAGPDPLYPGSQLRLEVAERAWALRIPRRRRGSQSSSDVRAVVDGLGVEIRHRGLGSLEGIAIGTALIAMSDTRPTARARFVLGHELGHILLHRGLLTAPEGAEEWVADWFARELLAPIRLLQTNPDADDRLLARRLRLPVQEVRAQLAAFLILRGLDAKPSWPCATCGTRAHYFGCQDCSRRLAQRPFADRKNEALACG